MGLIAHPFLFPQVPFAPRSGLPQTKSRPGHVGAAPPRRMQLAGLPSKPSPTFASPTQRFPWEPRPRGECRPQGCQATPAPSSQAPTHRFLWGPRPRGECSPQSCQATPAPSSQAPTHRFLWEPRPRGECSPQGCQANRAPPSQAPTHRFPWEPRPRGECSPQGCQQPQPTTKPHPSADSRQSVPPARPSAGSRRCIALPTSGPPHAVALGHEIRPARLNARYASPRSI